MKTLQFEISPNFYIKADAYGDAGNPAILFLHGGGQTRNSWGDTAEVIAKEGYYCLALDARGHGDSSWSPDAGYTPDHLASDLKFVIAQLNTKPALVGASMGGITSLVAVGESEQPIASAVVLVDIAPKAEQKGIERIFAFMSANLHGFANLDEAADAVAAYLPHRPRPQDHSRLQNNLRLRADGRYYWHWDPAMLKIWKNSTPDQRTKHEERLYNAAKNLNVPTLIVRGGMSDVVSEKVMAEFLDAVPGVQSVNVSGASHMVAGDSNHAFTHAVLEFLKEVFPPNHK